jgi:hypothetical protein
VFFSISSPPGHVIFYYIIKEHIKFHLLLHCKELIALFRKEGTRKYAETSCFRWIHERNTSSSSRRNALSPIVTNLLIMAQPQRKREKHILNS